MKRGDEEQVIRELPDVEWLREEARQIVERVGGPGLAYHTRVRRQKELAIRLLNIVMDHRAASVAGQRDQPAPLDAAEYRDLVGAREALQRIFDLTVTNGEYTDMLDVREIARSALSGSPHGAHAYNVEPLEEEAPS